MRPHRLLALPPLCKWNAWSAGGARLNNQFVTAWLVAAHCVRHPRPQIGWWGHWQTGQLLRINRVMKQGERVILSLCLCVRGSSGIAHSVLRVLHHIRLKGISLLLKLVVHTSQPVKAGQFGLTKLSQIPQNCDWIILFYCIIFAVLYRFNISQLHLNKHSAAEIVKDKEFVMRKRCT